MGQFSTASSGNDLDFLNINQTINCIAAGPISSRSLPMSSGSDSRGSSIRPQITGQSDAGVVRKKSIRRKSQLNNDALVVGTKSSIHVYDILHNSDLYYKEVCDNICFISEISKFHYY